MKPLRVHCIQHVPFESPGYIIDWAKDHAHALSRTAVYKHDPWPLVADFDLLVVMGGPMGVYDENKYEWLIIEKKLIAEAIAGDKLVLGICLGGQLIASVLGAPVRPGKNKEIGWFPLNLTKAGDNSLLKHYNRTVFHWHGDAFEIPENATHLAESMGCKNQAFLKGKVLGLQFHPEIKAGMVAEMIKYCGHELGEKSEYIQSEETLLNTVISYDHNKQLLYDLLNDFIVQSLESS